MTRPPKLPKDKVRIAARGAADARRHRRVDVTLECRFGRRVPPRHQCRLEDISAGGARVIADHSPRAGETIYFDVESIGYLEAEAVRVESGAFTVRWTAGPRRRERIVEVLTWRWNAERLGLEKDRHGERQPGSGLARVRLADGVEIAARVADVSRTGMQFHSDRRPALGARVTVGRLSGAVTRFTDRGFAVRFDDPPAAAPQERDEASDAA